MMFALATAEQPALYFSVLGEPPLKMLRYQQQFSFFDSRKINKAVRFINLSDEAAAGDLQKVLTRIASEVVAHRPSFVFVDSFRSVIVASKHAEASSLSLQQFVQQLGMMMTGWQATTFLIGEYTSDHDPDSVFTVADGLHVFAPMQANPADTDGASPLDNRVKMGVPSLDDMMGGGLPRGYSLLVAGPSGSGKSILAAEFLVEGARLGEIGIIAAFEQRPTFSRGRALADVIASEPVKVVDTRSESLSVDEIAMMLVDEVRRSKATRLVIDSLSGFELALAPTFRDDYRESLSRLVSALASTGVTVLMTSELEDRFSDLRFSPYGTAFLTDAIIVQRYVEINGRLLRAMAVVKVRASAHSNELRHFHIDDHGIRIGDPMADYAGLLSGRPTARVAAELD
jgi:circadian clock protein KaiC